MKPTNESLDLANKIAETVPTFHLHYHILYDIAKSYPDDYLLNYVEIGCYAGASSCLMLQRPNTRVASIDIDGFSGEEIIANIERNNPHDNSFRLLKVNSHLLQTKEDLKEYTDHIDILFIDGGHSFGDAVSDFVMYQELVEKGGYIIFDDYIDPAFKEVHYAVDALIKVIKGYEIMGTFENVLGARGFPEGDTRGNCFVMRKK
jgi:predicted O-methyltransferase YrrM